MSNSIIDSAKKMMAANQDAASSMLTIQNYCNSVKSQPKVDFSGEPSLMTYEKQINAGLLDAQDHANNYLNTIQPLIVENVTSIERYYDVLAVIPATLPPGSSEQQWISELNAIVNVSKGYQRSADIVVASLSDLNSQFATDAAAFTTTVSNLNAAVDGDNGVLATLNGEISSIQHDINGEIAGLVVSGLAVLGGAFVIAVGAVADFVTAGTSTGVVVGGIGIVAAGVAGTAAASTMLVKLNARKASLLNQEASLKNSVKLATGIGQSFSSLSGQLNSAVTAASNMKSAWELLSGDIGQLVADLKSGITSAGAVRTLFLDAANEELDTVKQDISTIKSQLTGIHMVPYKPSRTIMQAIEFALKQSGDKRAA